MARVIILGRTGLLGSALAEAKPETEHEIVAVRRETIDLEDLLSIETRLAALAPSVVINAAGFTNVDQAESQSELAFVLNRDAPAMLARACARLGAPFVHISTDYVFDGQKGAPYVEDDAKAPLNLYGCSKSEGEDAVMAVNPDAVVIRTGAVFDLRGRNFVMAVLRSAEARREVRAVEDQTVRPTWAHDLAGACLSTAHAMLSRENKPRGVFHFVGADDVTWADFAEAIFAHAADAGLPTARVKRVRRTEFAQVARRPADSRMDASKIARELHIAPRPWHDALALCFARTR